MRLLLLVLAVLGLAGFAAGWFLLPPPSGTATPVVDPPPAGPGAPAAVVHRFTLTAADVKLDRETPAVAVDGRGRVLVAWAASSGDNEHTLWLARSDDGGTTFAEPTPFRKVPIYRYTSSKGKQMTFSTNAVPRLTVAGETIFLGWTEAIDGGPRVEFRVARSTDGGRTFAEAMPAHGSDAVRPGFTSLRAGPDGALTCTWLDGRGGAQRPFCSVAPPGAARFQAEGLAYAASTGGGVCPCCDVDAVRTADGAMYVAFRDNDDNCRDVRVARSGPDGTFRTPVAVAPEHWRFEGCPHDGPSLAVASGRLHVLWMDAHDGRRRVYRAASDLTDLQFTPHELSPGPGEQGHPRLVAAGPVLHAVWDESSGAASATAGGDEHAHHHGAPVGGTRTVRYARSSDGADFGPAVALDARPGAFQVNPAVAVGPDGVACVVCNELTEAGKSVVFLRVPESRR